MTRLTLSPLVFISAMLTIAGVNSNAWSACLFDFTSGTNNLPERNPQVECFERSLGGNNDEEWWSEPVNGVI